ncbi:MAG: DUF4395 domain-containing protein [Dehalococcoidia bacterium]|nr:DUF4395 domain-containing protein [Dehalococcoidia bacterium]
MREFLRFPDPVNEVAARLVASGVVLMTAAILAFQAIWLVPVLCFGFVARVFCGPRVSPLALLVTRVVVPALPLAERPTPGPPKRFAQGIGATLSLAATLLAFAFGLNALAYALVAAIMVAASLEAFLGFCLGCRLFALLMAAGLIPPSLCEACADITKRRAAV